MCCVGFTNTHGAADDAHPTAQGEAMTLEQYAALMERVDTIDTMVAICLGVLVGFFMAWMFETFRGGAR